MTLFDDFLSHIYLSKAVSFLGLPSKEMSMAYKEVLFLTFAEDSVETMNGAAAVGMIRI